MKIKPQKRATDKTLARRLYKFLRFHKIDHQPQDGLIYLGSAICRIVNGDLVAYFPQFSKEYGNSLSFSIEFDDCYNTYVKFSTRHNSLINSFPRIKKKAVPELHHFTFKLSYYADKKQKLSA